MIFLTGATGLVGSRLLFDLVSAGSLVRAMRRKGSKGLCVDRYFNGHYNLLERVEWVEGDLLDIDSLEENLNGITDVYHCAGMVSFNPADRDQMYQVNVTGTANLVNACLEKGIRKFCHVSSVAALGRSSSEAEIDENETWTISKNNSWYAVTKYGAEREVWRGIAEGLTAVIVNPAIILGPGNWKNDSSALFSRIWAGLRFYTIGESGFVDVRDVSQAMQLLMKSPIESERFILVSENNSFREVLNRIAKGLGKNPPSFAAGPMLSAIAWRAEYIRGMVTGTKPLVTKETARTAQNKYHYSKSKIIKATGIQFIPVGSAVDETVEWFLKEQLHPVKQPAYDAALSG